MLYNDCKLLICLLFSILYYTAERLLYIVGSIRGERTIECVNKEVPSNISIVVHNVRQVGLQALIKSNPILINYVSTAAWPHKGREANRLEFT